MTKLEAGRSQSAAGPRLDAVVGDGGEAEDGGGQTQDDLDQED